MKRTTRHATLIGLLICAGCGSKVAQETAPERPSTAVAKASAPEASMPSPTDVVSLFLDRVRRGGQDSAADELLTLKARSELKRIGRVVQPFGVPDARFVVTRGEAVPGEKDAALVHSVWSEPAADGAEAEYQVVWALQKEQQGWRISGLAMELEPNQEPMIIDFENGELMAKLLPVPEDPIKPTGEVSQAPPADPSVSR